MKNYYDIEQLKAVKISDILRDYGILVNKSGFFSIRNERTPSCKIYVKTNSFYDFGSAIGGNSINLIEHLEKCSRMDAMDKLATMYGIEPVNKFDRYRDEKIRLTDSQYALIGITADKATKNMVFDLELDLEELKRISDRYMMPMNDLKEKYLPVYETIISTMAAEEVNRKRSNYQEDMYHDYVFRNLMKIIENLPIPSIPPAEEITRKFGDVEKELNRVEKVMENACRGCKNIRFKRVNHDAVAEYRNVAAEMDLNRIYQALQDNPIWFDAFEENKRKEIMALPKDHHDFSDVCENVARKIVAVIENDAGKEQKLQRETEQAAEK